MFTGNRFLGQFLLIFYHFFENSAVFKNFLALFSDNFQLQQKNTICVFKGLQILQFAIDNFLIIFLFATAKS